MNDDGSSFYGAPEDRVYALVERRFRETRDNVYVSTPDAVLRSFTELRNLVDADVRAIKQRLFIPSLASREDDKVAGRWISAQHRRLARIAHRMAEAFARLSGPNEYTFRLLAPALHYMGESVKGHVKETHFHHLLNATMRLAYAYGSHHEEIQFDIAGRLAPCTFTSLYFRALLLARLAGGGLTFAQMEIVDAWMWIWMPALAGSDAKPKGAAWRADLDSNEGLRRARHAGAGLSLWLAQAPIDAVRLAIIKEFHSGRTVPASGEVAKLPIDDHFAALEAVRRALRGIRHESGTRSRRRGALQVVELHVGLAEVMAVTAHAGPAIELTPMSVSGSVRAEGDHDTAEVRAPVRRPVQMIDLSETGASLEGEEADCSEVAVDDLVALRLAPGEPVMVGKIVRRLPAATGGRVLMGLLRLTSAAQPVRAVPSPADATLPDLALLYIPGLDGSGRHDAYLTSDAVAAGRTQFETTVGEDIFTFRFNRVRERGRGWVMAGFEVMAARRRAEPPPRKADTHKARNEARVARLTR